MPFTNFQSVYPRIGGRHVGRRSFILDSFDAQEPLPGLRQEVCGASANVEIPRKREVFFGRQHGRRQRVDAGNCTVFCVFVPRRDVFSGQVFTFF